MEKKVLWRAFKQVALAASCLVGWLGQRRHSAAHLSALGATLLSSSLLAALSLSGRAAPFFRWPLRSFGRRNGTETGPKKRRTGGSDAASAFARDFDILPGDLASASLVCSSFGRPALKSGPLVGADERGAQIGIGAPDFDFGSRPSVESASGNEWHSACARRECHLSRVRRQTGRRRQSSLCPARRRQRSHFRSRTNKPRAKDFRSSALDIWRWIGELRTRSARSAGSSRRCDGVGLL